MIRIASILLQLWFFITAPFRRNLFTQAYSSILTVDYTALQRAGISLIIFDLDDTVTHWRDMIPNNVLDFLASLQRMGFSIALLSNSTQRRADIIAQQLKPYNILILQSPTKPFIGGFRTIASHHQTAPEKTAMIGDRLATDMWSAQRANIAERILVGPYPNDTGGHRSLYIQTLVRAIEQSLYGGMRPVVRRD